jgi:hypothetical protein
VPYPKYLHNDMGALAGYLLEPPAVDDFDEDGCFSAAACKKVEAMILADLSPKLKGFYMPAEPAKGTDPNNRWRTVSCLQKAIRFGDAEMAKFAASAAYDMDKKYLMRRLGIIAIEDVGMGTLYGMLAVLAVSGSSAWREAADERRLFCFLAEMLANAPKDRTACELCCVADFDKTVPKEEWGKWTNEQLADVMLDHDDTLERRMIAAWMMAGTKKFFGTTMPKENDRPARHLFALMAKSGMCRATLYAAAKIASRLSEGMFVSLFFMDEWMRATPRVTLKINEMPPTPKVGKLLGAAYDMHTREGRTAIGKFRKETWGELKKFLEMCPNDTRELQLWFGIFLAEGGVLSRRVVYKNTPELYALTERLELAFPGLPEPLHGEFMGFLKANIDKLNECRSKVLYATLQNKK